MLQPEKVQASQNKNPRSRPVALPNIARGNAKVTFGQNLAKVRPKAIYTWPTPHVREFVVR